MAQAVKDCSAGDYVDGTPCYTCYGVNNVPACDKINGKKCNALENVPRKKNPAKCTEENKRYRFLCRCGSTAATKVYHATDKDGAKSIVTDSVFRPSSGGIFGRGIYLALSKNQALAKGKAFHIKDPKVVDTVVVCAISGVPAYIPKFGTDMEGRTRDGKDQGDTSEAFWAAKLRRKQADYFYINDLEDA